MALAWPKSPSRPGLHQGHSPRILQTCQVLTQAWGENEQKRKWEGDFIVAQPISHFDRLQMFLFFIALFLLPAPPTI